MPQEQVTEAGAGRRGLRQGLHLGGDLVQTAPARGYHKRLLDDHPAPPFPPGGAATGSISARCNSKDGRTSPVAMPRQLVMAGSM